MIYTFHDGVILPACLPAAAAGCDPCRDSVHQTTRFYFLYPSPRPLPDVEHLQIKRTNRVHEMATEETSGNTNSDQMNCVCSFDRNDPNR